MDSPNLVRAMSHLRDRQPLLERQGFPPPSAPNAISYRHHNPDGDFDDLARQMPHIRDRQPFSEMPGFPTWLAPISINYRHHHRMRRGTTGG